jgi:hypothetical protein
MRGEESTGLKPMAQRYERPAWVRRLNSIVEASGASLRDLVPIDADALLETGVRAAGGMPKGDFGDPHWQDAFLRLARSIDTGDLHLLGRLITKGELLRSLRSRLLMTHEVENKPAILDGKVTAPVIVTGPARSGTSILFELLSLDPDLVAPAAWQALHPVAHAGDGDDAGDERLQLSEFEQELWADLQPEFAAIHELRSDLPVECVTLCMPSFTGPHWAMIAKLGEWVPEMDRDYQFHRHMLQFLQRNDPSCTWLLKTPGHLGNLPMLFETYPDAWVVQTHRDPAKSMPSTVSTTAMVQWMRTDQVDLDMLRAVIDGVFGNALNDSVTLRESGGLPKRFVDVHFLKLLKEPVETLRRAYASMERDFTPEHGERIRAYLADKPKGKFGVHRYTPEEWGFTREDLHDRLAPYINHYGVELE